MISRNHECQKCNYKTNYIGDLNNHIKSKHEGVKFPCHQCDFKSTWRKNLMAHVKAIHEGGKFPCSQCD